MVHINNLRYPCYIEKYSIYRVITQKITEEDYFWFYNMEPNFPDVFREKKIPKQQNPETLQITK